SIVLAAVCVAVIGIGMEVFLFRRVYGRPVADQLLLTFAMVLIIHDVVRLAYGSNLRSVPRPPLLAGAVFLGDVVFPSYYIFIVLTGAAVLLGFWAFLHKTRLGKTIRAAVGNREMVACLGKPLPWLFTAAFPGGVVVDGLAGAIGAPLGGIRLGMDFDIIILAFATVIVGGFGSLPGTALAAFIIAEADPFGTGLSRALRVVLLRLGVVALGPPQFAEPIVVHTAIEILIMALFAMSFNLLFDGAGLLTFGHGCSYGVGAYTAALLMTEIGMPMFPAMFAAMVMGGLVALVFGYFCVRLTGVYFSILTLALAQLMFSVFQQSYTVTGGDLGILDVQPPAFLMAVNNYYYFTLVVVGVWLWLLWRILPFPFGGAA